METVLRFYYDTNIDFYADEVTEIIVTKNIQRKIYNNENNYYGIYRIGAAESEYKTIDISFNMFYGGTGGTLDKINTLYGYRTNSQPLILDCYYKYKLSPTTVIQVKMILQQMKWRYVAGVEEADYTLPVSFVEVKPEGVGMIQFPMLQTLGNGT